MEIRRHQKSSLHAGPKGKDAGEFSTPEYQNNSTLEPYLSRGRVFLNDWCDGFQVVYH